MPTKEEIKFERDIRAACVEVQRWGVRIGYAGGCLGLSCRLSNNFPWYELTKERCVCPLGAWALALQPRKFSIYDGVDNFPFVFDHLVKQSRHTPPTIRSFKDQLGKQLAIEALNGRVLSYEEAHPS